MLKAGALADRVFCRYSELSVNTCENRLIKRALLFAERIVGRMLDQRQQSAVMLQGRLNGCLDALAGECDNGQAGFPVC